jgi:hypothetical protein
LLKVLLEIRLRTYLDAHLRNLRAQIFKFVAQHPIPFIADACLALDLLVESCPIARKRADDGLLRVSVAGRGVHVDVVQDRTFSDFLAVDDVNGLDPSASWRGNFDQTGLRDHDSSKIDAPSVAAEGHQRCGRRGKQNDSNRQRPRRQP